MTENNIFSSWFQATHHLQYPPGLTYLKAYFESRGGKHDEVVFFGLQYVLKKYLTTRVTKEMIDEAEEVTFYFLHWTENECFKCLVSKVVFLDPLCKWIKMQLTQE